MTGAGVNCFLLGKVLDVVNMNINIWKTEWTEHIDSRKQRVNKRVLGWEMILYGPRYFLESFFKG